MGAEADVRMPLTAHLEELRTRLIRGLLAIAIGFAACYGFSEPLVAFLIRPLQSIRPDQALVIGTGVTDAFFTKLKVSAVAGIFLASPAVFYQAWQFVAPGLYERERRVALPFSLAASFFFVAGAAFCYYAVFPVAFRFFLEQFASIDIAPQIRVSEYLSFVSRMLLAFGATFELPVVTFFLARIGLVTHRMMIAVLALRDRRHLHRRGGADARARRRLADADGDAAAHPLRPQHRDRVPGRTAVEPASRPPSPRTRRPRPDGRTPRAHAGSSPGSGPSQSPS